MGQKVQHLAKWLNTAHKALDNGGAMTGPTRLRWNVAGNGRLQCQSPVFREYIGAEPITEDLRHDRPKGRKNTRSIELDTRCRRCPPCLEARKLLWRGRARAEVALASRTWFGTLTVSPDHQAYAQYRADLRLGRQGVVWDDLTREEQFAERVREISPEITKWFKRVRKQASVALRQKARKDYGCKATVGKRCTCHPLRLFTVTIKYLLVVEEHTGGGEQHGLPHFHLLIHEVHEGRPVRHECMKSKWSLGHTDFKLIPPPELGGIKYANYVTKYLTKSFLCRARASLKYGRTS